MRCVFTILLLAGVVLSAEPSADEQREIIAKVRAYAQGYREGLQDFTCVKTVTRWVDTSGTGAHWKKLETVEQQLNYVRQKESYKTLRVDGAPYDPKKPLRRRYTTVGGEFSSLGHIFSPLASVQFEWHHREGSVCVLRYDAQLSSGAALHWRDGGKDTAIPHHGFVYANCADGVVTRLNTMTYPSKSNGLRTDVSFGAVSIGGKNFMLPVTADDMSIYGKTQTHAEVTFTNYRKYAADSAIRFDAEPAQ